MNIAFLRDTDCQDLVKQILTANLKKRITVAGILKHPWMQTDVSVDVSYPTDYFQGIETV